MEAGEIEGDGGWWFGKFACGLGGAAWKAAFHKADGEGGGWEDSLWIDPALVAVGRI